MLETIAAERERPDFPDLSREPRGHRLRVGRSFALAFAAFSLMEPRNCGHRPEHQQANTEGAEEYNPLRVGQR